MQANRYIVVVTDTKGQVTYADSYWDYSLTDMTRARLYVQRAPAQRLADRISNFKKMMDKEPRHLAVVKEVSVVVEML